ncbi:MAG: hypothetical protein ABI203_03500, partial [Mucilaginibacter sp.]
DVYNENGGVRLGAAISRKLIGKRAVQLYLSLGVNADIIRTSFELNPLNDLSNSELNGNTSIYETFTAPLYKQYYIPPIGLKGSLDIHLYNVIFSLNTAYKNKDFGFTNNKQPLYNSNLAFELKIGFVLGYKYN